MAENRDEQTLSTADMAAAAEQQQRAPSTTATATDTPPQNTPNDGAAVSQAAGAPAAEDDEQRARLLDDTLTGDLRRRWTDVQASFVDEPRQAVKQADGLVAEVMKQLAETFAQERSHLEQQWDHGGDVSTEELRVALRRYRSFFERLLSA